MGPVSAFAHLRRFTGNSALTPFALGTIRSAPTLRESARTSRLDRQPAFRSGAFAGFASASVSARDRAQAHPRTNPRRP